MGTRILVLLAALSLMSSCGFLKKAAKKIEDALFEDPPYDPVPGEEATRFLANAAGVDKLDLTALNEAFAVAEKESSEETLALLGYKLAGENDEVSSVGTGTIDLLKQGAEIKKSIKSESFVRPDLNSLLPQPPQGRQYPTGFFADEIPIVPTEFNPKTDTISEDSWQGKTEILVPNLDRVPVRDQQQRGTCAAFTGIGYLEYLVLKKYGDKLESIDLSEQRFYLMSRQDLWATGGTTDVDGGSAWESGFEMSYGQEGKTSPTDVLPYNIPLELDCPYSGSPGDNELQIPQRASCKRGAVRVKSLTETYWEIDSNGNEVTRSNSIRSAQEIFNYLRDKGLPVPVGTTLTANWMDNDGMITYAKSAAEGSGPHAGGHAYLIVGARKLDEAKFPGEGGMCFVIKNSWGLGWGINGYSCMTLKWFNEYRGTYPMGLALDLEWDEAYTVSKMGAPDITTPTEEPGTSEPVETEGTPVAIETDTNTPPAAPEDFPPAGPPADPAVKTTPDGYTVAKLLSKQGRLFTALYKITGEIISIKGVYPGNNKVTKPLDLTYRKGKIYFDDPTRNKSQVQGGAVEGDSLYLCSKGYADVCHLNLDTANNSLIIGVTQDEFLNQTPDLEASYVSLFDLANYGVEYHYPGGLNLDVKLKLGGSPTNPIRLKFKPSEGAIFFKGVAIGSLTSFQLCTGEFKSVCRFLVDRDKNSMNIFLKARKNE